MPSDAEELDLKVSLPAYVIDWLDDCAHRLNPDGEAEELIRTLILALYMQNKKAPRRQRTPKG